MLVKIIIDTENSLSIKMRMFFLTLQLNSSRETTLNYPPISYLTTYTISNRIEDSISVNPLPDIEMPFNAFGNRADPDQAALVKAA